MAGCCDRTWHVGSKARGTRSQFRLNPQGLLPFKCTYPVHLTDVMDVGQSSQTGLLTAGDLVSPNKVTRTRTVREYEQTISELKKENFDLKLRIFLLEEAINKNSRKDKECNHEDKDNTVQVIVQLKVETESLRNELSYKNKLLQDSLDQAEKYSSELKELQAECSRLQDQLSTLSERPSKSEFMLLQDEKENLLKENEFLTNELSTKNNEIQEINSKVEELSSRNKHLEEKVKKSCMAIQGVVHKYYKETELCPKVLRPIIHSAVQAAKNNNQEELVLSLKRFKATLCQIMPTSIDEFDTVFKENEVNNHSKQNLKERTFQHKEKEKIEKNRVLKHPSESHVELSHIQDLKKMFPGNGCSDKERALSLELSEEFSSCEVMLSDSGKSVASVGDNCLVDVFICSDIHQSIEEQQIPEVQLSDHTLNHSVSCIKNSTMINEIFLPSEISIETLNGNKSLSGKIIDSVPIKYQNIRDVSNNEKEKELLLQLSNILKENESLKSDIKDKLSIINDLTSTCNELEQKTIHLQSELHDTVFKLKQLEIKSTEEKGKVIGPLLKTNFTQTSAADLLTHSKTETSVDRIGQSNNIAELKEEILVLLLTIEEKDKELTDLKQEITSLQTELENVLNKRDVTFSNMDPEYLNERNELRERLALSCSVNNELIKHLQNLEAFMEDLLHQRNLDASSLENISETSDFISQLSRCLDESLKLSHALSDHLSICEASKLFEAGEISGTQDISVYDSKSSRYLGLSKLSSNVTDPYFKFDEGSTSKRLFARESSIRQDYKLEKHYSLLSEKFPKLSSMLNQLEKVKDANSDMVILEDIYEELNGITSSVSETLHKLTVIKENMKNLTPIICEKCTVLELLLKLEKVRRRIQHSEILQYVSGTNAEPLVHALLTEVDSLKKQLEEPHAVLSSGANTSESENEIVKNENIGNITDRKSVSEAELKELKDLKLRTELLEKELNEMREVSEEDKRSLESLKIENHALSNHLNNLKQEILDLEEKKTIVTSENSGFIQKLTEVNEKNNSLKDFIKELEQKAADSNIAYNQLKGDLEKNREQLEKLDVKCLQYEEEILAQSKEKKEFVEKIKNMESEAQTEKKKHIKETEKLISEKHDLLKNLELEKKKSEFLEKEKRDLNTIIEINNKEIESLRILNQELETAKQNLLNERDHLKCDLLSNTSLCDELNNDLKKIRESLQDMELKCAKYEQEFEESSNNKRDLINKLSAIKREFASKICKLDTFHKGKEESSFLNKPSDVTSIIDKDKCIENLCDELARESNRFFEITDNLMRELKDINLHLQEEKGAKENLQIKISAIQKKTELQETEIKHLVKQKEHLQTIVDEQEKCIGDKEKSLRLSDTQIQSLSIQLSNLRTEMDQDKFELNQKDDEITTLQERIFNLNTEINNLKAEKYNLEATNGLLKFRNEKSKDNTNIGLVLNSSIGVKSPDDTNLEQGSEINISEIQEKGTDISMDSVSEKDDKSNLISFRNKEESYIKKINTLKAKLSMKEKRIEILEKEKENLRDSILAQVCNDKKIKALMEDKEVLNQQLSDLKSNLEKKATFIRELKNDLYSTCNSLVDKTQEVNNLKEELSKYKEKSELNSQIEQKNFESNLSIFPQNVNGNIQNLKKHKWELIQEIFSLQRKFYEKKGIHLEHFNKFKNHIENLYSLQFSSMLCKSESEPLLHMDSEGYSGEDRTLKNILIGLELDIECLENLRIFLKRFFIPFVLHNSHMPGSKYDKDDSSLQVPKASFESNEENCIELLKQSMMNGKVTEESCKDTFKNIEILRIGSDDYMSPFHRNKWNKLVWNVSCQLDGIENSLRALQSEYGYFKQIESSIGESPCKNAEKSLLSKIFYESKLLHQEANKIISLNSTLKSSTAFTRNISKGASKQDMSDRESLLSDETITLSRSESLSPVSFEEAFPIRITSTEQNEQNALQKMSIESKNVVEELFPDRLETVGSSQDSVFHRSHYSSPDLGIESDPNHESSAPEQMEKEECRVLGKHQSESKVKQKVVGKPLQKLTAPPVESKGEAKGNEPYFVTGGVLHAIGILQDYELLKKEIKESLVGIKSVLSRTGDGLHHIAKCTSPRKKLEYSTFKAIKDTCAYIEVCLKEAYKLVCNFWTAPHPCTEEWNALIQENQEFCTKLDKLKHALEEKENDFRKAMDNMEAAKLEKEKMNMKITRKLVKTKNILKQTQKKLIENGSQNLLPMPKYPSEDFACQGKR